MRTDRKLAGIISHLASARFSLQPDKKPSELAQLARRLCRRRRSDSVGIVMPVVQQCSGIEHQRGIVLLLIVRFVTFASDR